MKRVAAAAALVALFAVGGCSDDTGGAIEVGDSPSADDCLDQAIDALNELDTSGLDASDGLDDVERATLTERFEAMGAEYPALDEGGACQSILDGATDDQMARLTDEVDPEVMALLAASAQQQFDQVGDTIGP